MITDLKLAETDFKTVDVKSLPDRPSEAGISAATLKATFDHVVEQLVAQRLNGLIDTLVSTGGATEIGVAAIDGVSGINVQAVLEAAKVLIDDRYTKAEADTLLARKFDAVEAVSLVRNVAFAPATGVFTMTNYDGSTYTIDTALAKVALDVRLDGQQFVLTLVDGTEQRVDLSSFIAQTEFDDSTTILFAVSAGRVSAGIKPGSLQLGHFDPEALSVLDTKMSAAAASADAAAASANNSQVSATQSAASASAADGSTKASAASAAEAAQSAKNAEQSSLAAKADRQLAEAARTDAETAVKDAAAEVARAANEVKLASDEVTRAASEADRAKAEADRAAAIVGNDFATNAQARELAETAKNAAIQTASADATAKVDAALASAKTYADKAVLMVDAATGKQYKWGVQDGAVYVEEAR